MQDIPESKNMEMSGLMIHVANSPIIEICPKLIAMTGSVVKVADNDALMLLAKKSGMNGIISSCKELLKNKIPNSAE